MPENGSLLVVIRQAPYSSHSLREGLDTALVAATFGQKVCLLFMGQGVYALLKTQAPGAPGQKATLPIIDMLAMYDIEQLFVPMETLKTLGIGADQLVKETTLVSASRLKKLFQCHSRILMF